LHDYLSHPLCVTVPGSAALVPEPDARVECDRVRIVRHPDPVFQIPWAKTRASIHPSAE
jgi:hypothetical protein